MTDERAAQMNDGAAVIGRGLDRLLDRVGRERLAVVERDPPAEVERPRLPVRALRPRLGEARPERGRRARRVRVDERLVEVGHVQHLGRERLHRIPGGHLCGRCDAQEIGGRGVLCRAGRADCYDDERRRDARAESDELPSSTHTTTSLSVTVSTCSVMGRRRRGRSCRSRRAIEPGSGRAAVKREVPVSMTRALSSIRARLVQYAIRHEPMPWRYRWSCARCATSSQSSTTAR